MAAALLSVLHFVLIHGACHGSWAWYRVEDQLKKAGHTVSSMDMASAGIDPTDPDTITTWEEYNKPALDFFQALPERAANEKKVVLVGHSMGGFTNLMLMERFSHKIDFAVFVAAVMVPSGIAYLHDTTLLTLMANDNLAYNYKNGTENPATSFYVIPSKIRHAFYNGLDSEIPVLASKLVKPSPMRMQATPITYTKEKYGRVPAVYIRYSQDRVLYRAAQEYIVNHCGPFREVVQLHGGHFNFLQRPKEFTNLLAKLAKKYIE